MQWIKTEYTEPPPGVEDRGNAGGRTTCRVNLDRTLSPQLVERGIQIRNSRIGPPGCPEFSVMNQSINHQLKEKNSLFQTGLLYIYYMYMTPEPPANNPGLSLSSGLERVFAAIFIGCSTWSAICVFSLYLMEGRKDLVYVIRVNSPDVIDCRCRQYFVYWLSGWLIDWNQFEQVNVSK